MTDEIRENLSLSRAGKSGYLTPWEREQVERDPALREEVELNEVLERINLETRTPPPPINQLLDKARSDARSRKKRRSRSVNYLERLGQFIEDKLPWSPLKLVQRTALLVAILVLWPLLLNGIGTVIKRHNAVSPAGVTAEAYHLTYTIQVPVDSVSSEPAGEGAGGTLMLADIVREAESICTEMMSRFFDWSELHPELTRHTTYQSTISYEDLFKEQIEGGREVGVVRIDVKATDHAIAPSLLQELVNLFAEIPEVGECVVVRVGVDEAGAGE